MADAKISGLTELAAAPATGDKIPIVDVSDTSEAATGTDKFIQASNLVPVDAAAATPSLRSLGATSTTAAPGDAAVGLAAQFHPLLTASCFLIHDQVAATLAMVDGGYAIVAPTYNTSAAAPVPTTALPLFRYVSTDHDINSAGSALTTAINIRAQVATSATNTAAITYTFGLFPVTVAGGTDTITFTLGGIAVTGPVITNPAASTIALGGPTGANSPSTGTYCLGCTTNATIANNSAVQISAQVYVSNS